MTSFRWSRRRDARWRGTSPRLHERSQPQLDGWRSLRTSSWVFPMMLMFVHVCPCLSTMYSREFGTPFVSTAWGLEHSKSSHNMRHISTPPTPLPILPILPIPIPTKALYHFRPLGLDAEAIQQRQQLLQRLRGDRLEVLTKAEDALEGRDLLHLRELCRAWLGRWVGSCPGFTRWKCSMNRQDFNTKWMGFSWF